MTAFNSFLSRTESEIPSDLRSTIDPNRLLQLIYQSISESDWPKVLPSAWSDATPEPLLRTLLIYSFATGVYSARDIEAATLYDRTSIYIVANHRPTWLALRAFRRRNSVPLKQALTALFQAAFSQNVFSSYEYYPEFRRTPFVLANPNQFEQEADTRLKRAIQADSMALDD